MGIDDRGYMRERRRRAARQTRWNEGKARVEAAWPDRRKPSREGDRARSAFLRRLTYLLLAGLCALVLINHLYGEAHRKGWTPGALAAEPFPTTGSVTLGHDISRGDITSSLTVIAGKNNAVVQLRDPSSNAHVLSVYVARDDRTTIPVPAGVFMVRLMEGQVWYGRKHHLGTDVQETLVGLTSFKPRAGMVIALDRRSYDKRKGEP